MPVNIKCLPYRGPARVRLGASGVASLPIVLRGSQCKVWRRLRTAFSLDRMPMRPLLPALLLCALTASTARADSDGYYCAGEGYLAVQFRNFSARGPAKKHVLRIVRWDADNGSRWAGEVVMDDFQPHGMICGRDEVVIEGAGDRPNGWLTYTVRFDSAGRPVIAARTNELPFDFTSKRSGNLPNLGEYSQPALVPLIGGTASTRFQLRITRTTHLLNPGVRDDRRSVLEECDEAGRVRRWFVLFDGMDYQFGQ